MPTVPTPAAAPVQNRFAARRALRKMPALAAELARAVEPLDLRDLARRVAEAEIDLRRIRRYRVGRLSEAVRAATSRDQPLSEGALAAALAPLAPVFKSLDRYERRALARRKFAIRDFATARQLGRTGIASWSVLRPARRRPSRRLPPPKEPVCVSEYVYLFQWLSETNRAAIERARAALARAHARAAAHAPLPLSNEEKSNGCWRGSTPRTEAPLGEKGRSAENEVTRCESPGAGIALRGRPRDPVDRDQGRWPQPPEGSLKGVALVA